MAHNRDYIRLINTRRWQKLRHAVLSENPFCADCAREGVVRGATEVHHVRPVESVRGLAAMERLAFDRGNLVALCRRCHKERHISMGKHTAAERKRRTAEEVAEFERKYFGNGDPEDEGRAGREDGIEEEGGVIFKRGEGV